MNALVLALALALGPGDSEEDRLPRSLSESFLLPVAPAAKEDHEILLGGHLGVARSDAGDSPCFVVGFEWRIHILPWLGASGSVDYQTTQHVDGNEGTNFYQVPFMWSFLLYPPIDLGRLRLYGLAGFGFTVTHVSGASVRISTDVNFLGSLGFGAEFELASGVFIDAQVSYVWAKDPSGNISLDADWVQGTVGLLFKLAK
ncbi:MAG TPA: outer membrane beta-barrel protein [Planctomycetota bacterium]|nr:outer membrane beta-barrel protein [Planctomycetota bacterium]